MSRFQLPFAATYDANGKPLAGAKLYFYESGTSTPLDTYSEDGLELANANPVVADAAGRFPNIFLKPQDYKCILKTAAGVTIWTADPVGLTARSMSYRPDSDYTGRSVEAKLGDLMSVTDFGAVGDNGTNCAAAFTAAVAKVGSGGTLLVPKGTFKLDSSVSAPGVCFLMLGSLSGSGSITGDGSTIVRLRGDLLAIERPFGEASSEFFAQHHFNSVSTAEHTDHTRANIGVKRVVTGSGANGPTKADFCAILSTEKKDYKTTTERGEVDVVYIATTQGAFDDQGGILIDHVKIGGNGTDDPDNFTGGSVGIESAGAWKDSAGATLMKVRGAFTFLEGWGDFSNNTGYGVWLEAEVGEPNTAFFAANKPSFGGFANLLVGAASREVGSEYFVIDGNGLVRANPGADPAAPPYSFIGDEDTGTGRLAANDIGWSTGGAWRWHITASGHLLPTSDNTYDIGSGSHRAANVYVASGTVSTSDARLKTEVRALTSDEIAAAKDLAAEIGAFKFLAAIEAKGDAAREHVGMTVQRAIEIMEARGLDPFDYGFICRDAWDDISRTEKPAAIGWRGTGRYVQSRGGPREVLEPYEIEPAEERVVTPAGDVYSFRMDELLAFIARGMAARFAEIEARLAALEA